MNEYKFYEGESKSNASFFSTGIITKDKGDNHLILVNNFTTFSILTRFSTSKISSLCPHEKGFKKQTLYQWPGSKNCSDEVARKTVNIILRGKDTCSHSKVQHFYLQKWWLCWEVRVWSAKDWFDFDVQYTFLCW